MGKTPKEIVPAVAAGLQGEHLIPQFANRFMITSTPATSRIASGEAAIGTDATFHSVVVLTADDALALGRELVRILGAPATAPH